MRTLKLAWLVTALGLLWAQGPQNLRCENATNPRGVLVPQPVLTWAAPPNAVQRGYQILVASTEEKLKANDPDLWDSGLVRSEKRTARYAGKPLASMQRCYWKIRVWENYFQNGSWTEPAMWEMGVLHFDERKSSAR